MPVLKRRCRLSGSSGPPWRRDGAFDPPGVAAPSIGFLRGGALGFSSHPLYRTTGRSASCDGPFRENDPLQMSTSYQGKVRAPAASPRPLWVDPLGRPIKNHPPEHGWCMPLRHRYLYLCHLICGGGRRGTDARTVPRRAWPKRDIGPPAYREVNKYSWVSSNQAAVPERSSVPGGWSLTASTRSCAPSGELATY